MTPGPPYFSRGTSLKPRSNDHTGCQRVLHVCLYQALTRDSISTCISLVIGAFWLLQVLQSLVGRSVDKFKWKWRSFYRLGFKNISRLVRGFDLAWAYLLLSLFWAHGSVTVNRTAVKLLELRTRISVAFSTHLWIMYWKMRLIGLGLYKVEIYSVRVGNRNLSYDYGYSSTRAFVRTFIFRTFSLKILYHL